MIEEIVTDCIQILNFLRDGDSFILPKDEDLVEEIRKEAQVCKNNLSYSLYRNLSVLPNPRLAQYLYSCPGSVDCGRYRNLETGSN